MIRRIALASSTTALACGRVNPSDSTRLLISVSIGIVINDRVRMGDHPAGLVARIGSTESSPGGTCYIHVAVRVTGNQTMLAAATDFVA